MKSKNILIKDFKNFDYGFLKATEAVFQSYGSEGKLACIQSGQDSGSYTKDGIRICKAVRFSNLTASAGAMAAIAGCARSVSITEDGTTLTSILMHSFVSKMDRSKFTKKTEAGIYEAINEVYHHLYKLSKKATKKDLKNIATVAVNGDIEIADLIVQAFDYVGADGFIDLVEDPDLEKSIFEKQEGILLKNHGFTSEYFSNKDERLVFEGQDVGVICASVWEYNQEIVNKIQQFYQGKPRETPLIVFIERSSSDFTEKLIGIKKVGFNVCVVTCNSHSEHASETLLNDIAIYTGASVYDPRNPDSQIIFGLADKITSNIENTTILNNVQTEEFKNLVNTIKSSEKPDKVRLKMLTAKASRIRVGGLTNLDRIERLHRLEDGCGSIKSATMEGVLPGGGSALTYISGLLNTDLGHKEKQQGYNLVKNVMLQPTIRLLKNGNRDQRKWFEFWKKDYITPAQKQLGFSYNSTKDELSDLYQDGIIDSKKTIRIAIESAVEQSIKVLNLGLIVHDPQEMTLD